MKQSMLIVLFLSSYLGFSQDVIDYKNKTSKNAKERSEILDLLREEIKNDLNQDVLFQVQLINVSGNYAWFEGDAIRKDRQKIEFPDESYDCCHVEGLFEKLDGKWKIIEFGAFSTDCWYCGIIERHPNVPKFIFEDSAQISQ